jgi:hypothetical protein
MLTFEPACIAEVIEGGEAHAEKHLDRLAALVEYPGRASDRPRPHINDMGGSTGLSSVVTSTTPSTARATRATAGRRAGGHDVDAAGLGLDRLVSCVVRTASCPVLTVGAKA